MLPDPAGFDQSRPVTPSVLLEHLGTDVPHALSRT